MKTLIKGATLISSFGEETSDILIENEKIAIVGECGNEPVDRVIHADGKLIFPGFIDAHTHFDLDVSNTTTADDFLSGSCAAVCGGTTSVIDFACPNKGESLGFGLKLWQDKASENGCACDYGFHMTIDDWNDGIESELPIMFQKGISSFKMYMTYPAMMIPDSSILEVLFKMKEYGGIAGVHCEDPKTLEDALAEVRRTGIDSPAAHPLSRPAEAEAAAVSRLLYLAEKADVPVTVVHLSSKAGLEEVRRARKRGQTVFVETCPQYLVLDDSYYSKDGFEGAKYVCAPPLRKESDIEALWAAIASGEIQTVSTDHCSFTLAQKEAGKDDFTKIPGGLPGVETRGLIMFSEGVAKGRISSSDMCRVLSENPARLYGLFPRKGILQAGSDADLVIFDPTARSVISASSLHGKCDYSPYEGLHITGKIDKVFLRGKELYSDGNLSEDRSGIFLFRNSYMNTL